ncbi:MAG TPA: maltose alpha-D-glucosyltransferase [Terriglobales bacterium]|nr:maltose alpha-D-glucosyltransferase [Terriglobales bacterium]
MARRKQSANVEPGEATWYKDAVVYQLHVRAFHDSDGDGIGDLRGLTQKLDYLQDLGVTALWVLPFYPSPLRDDGYDIADYTSVHPSYGTLLDFRNLLREAHRRGLRVITELVLNHTSDQHAWFQRARREPKGSVWRNFYVWSDTPDRYRDARIIFKDFEASNWTWDPVAKAYFWHRFYCHQPDLNFDNPAVHRALFHVVDFWLEMGVDGMRLDAVPYLYEREGTNCENLPETHAFLKALRAHVDKDFPGRMLLAEANQWPEDAVAYFGEGDECHMAFHFPLMPRMFMAIRMEDRYPILDILQQTPSIPPLCQWAIFLRNHDELTLEMVTDEERDYMYRVYANDPQARINLGIRRRLAPLLERNRAKIELMNGLLFSLPGTPVVYYGDEIGMGDNIYLGDRNGVRTPMQWTPDRNAGFSRANSQRLFLPLIIDPDFHYESTNVESSQQNAHSILWWTKRLIAFRKQHHAFGWGTLEFLSPENRRVLAFVRRFQEQTILVVANLSRFAQYVELDLSAYKDMVPVELSGRTEFPPIGELPYLLTLGGYAFHWFALEPRRVAEVESVTGEIASAPTVAFAGGWQNLLRKGGSRSLERALPRFLVSRRWFGSKARRVKSATVADGVPLQHDGGVTYIAIVNVEYTEGDPENYSVPLSFAAGEQAERIEESHAHSIVARTSGPDGKGVIYGAMRDPGFCAALLETIARRRRLRGQGGEVVGRPTRAFRSLRGETSDVLPPSLLRTEQSNSSVLFGDRMILKVFRKLQDGVNPDLEIGAFLTEKTGFRQIAPVAGALEYQRKGAAPITLGILQGFVVNQGDAWQYSLDALSRFYERVTALPTESRPETMTPVSPLTLASQDLPEQAGALIGTYLESARLLGQRTAEMHLALASDSQDSAFVPEAFTPFYQRSLYQSMRNLASNSFQMLRQRIPTLPEAVRSDAQAVVGQEAAILGKFRAITEGKISAMRTRIHGDYHLGQVLHTGDDFVIIDFEGEPARSIGERRIKRSPLRDVAGMLRSFHYAAYAALLGPSAGRAVRPEDLPALEPWAFYWYAYCSAVFLRAYLQTAAEGVWMPRNRGELQLLLEAYLLEKAIYELGYELNNRPDWLQIPVHGVLDLLKGSSESR